jgi:hypothetical protein
MHRVQQLVKNSPILMIIADRPDEKIIMTEIVSWFAVERKASTGTCVLTVVTIYSENP